jgi:hypothetical protein
MLELLAGQKKRTAGMHGRTESESCYSRYTPTP